MLQNIAKRSSAASCRFVTSSVLAKTATPSSFVARLSPSLRAMSSSSSSAAAVNIAKAKEQFFRADAVCFDVDSTVVTEEGIDVLAAYCGAGEAVAEMTRKAMGGTMLFHDALEARLKLIKPSAQQVKNLLKEHPLELTPGMDDLVQVLHGKKVAVYLVSGGFRQMINPVADILGIPTERIFANNLLFHPETGDFVDFDRNEPTSRAGGKGKVVGFLKEKYGYKNVVMVGDGATDLEARPPADMFIGFGGVVVREAVRKGADWYAMSMEELINAAQGKF